KTRLNVKKAILWSIVLCVIQMILGNLLYMNPIVMGINERFAGYPSIKSFDFIGGLGNWILLTMIFGIFMLAFWIFLYNLLYNSLPGKKWVKGLSFGLLIGFIRSVPEAFNQWMVIDYPVPLILVQLFNTFVSLIIFGALLGFIFYKFKVIEE
ncbi:MAG: hypothetical protein AB1649_34385, partial [Chloroflexota bacterium]